VFARSGLTPKSYFPMRKLCKLYLRLLHPKAIAGKAAGYIYFFYVVLIFWYRLHGILFFKITYFALRKILG
jgi:hypothetical protein